MTTQRPTLFRNLSLPEQSRRRFVEFLLGSPFAASLILNASSSLAQSELLGAAAEAANVFQFEEKARTLLDPVIYQFVAGGADDMKTVQANRDAFDQVQIRARRLIDVSTVNTSVTVLGQAMKTPIIMAPVGGQQQVHDDGEMASARAAAAKDFTFMVSTVSSYSVGEIAAVGGDIWFQLYASPDRGQVRALLNRAEEAGAAVVALTVDSAVLGNRERQNIARRQQMDQKGARRGRLGNFEGMPGGRPRIGDPSLNWEFIDWLRANTKMKVILKGIVTHEDATLCLAHGVDGLIISNHGGRQEESNRGTLEALPEIVQAIEGQIPILIDGGFRRGTDIFKALALGATAICIGRPYIWGLAAFGEDGVAKVLDLLHGELVRIMQLAGAASLQDITPNHIGSRL